MKQLFRALGVIAVAGIAVVFLASPADAKVLPYQLEVLGTQHRVGQPVTIVMHPHPQNVLGETFSFEVRWAKVPQHQRVARVVRRRGIAVTMRQVAPGEYRGSFTPAKAGRHVVYGRTGSRPWIEGYPRPIRVRVQR